MTISLTVLYMKIQKTNIPTRENCMSIKGYLIKIEDLNQVKILTDYLTEIGEFVGWFSGALQVNKTINARHWTTPFNKGDIVARILVDRGDLTESFVDETKVCSLLEVPTYRRLVDFELDENGIANMDEYPEITLENLHLLFVR